MEWFFPALVGVVAFVYAMVGHGGASGYLALGILFGLAPQTMRQQALLLNLWVAGLSFYAFAREGHFKPRLLLPLALASMPAAYLGARLNVDPTVTGVLLGIALLAASGRMLMPSPSRRETGPAPPRPVILAGTGLVLGALAGMTGVGGGIYLSPLLLLSGWARVKETAAVSAAFIWLNSAAGLAGLAASGSWSPTPWSWLGAALVGGALGSKLGARRLPAKTLRQALGLVLLAAALKLLAGA